MKFKVIGVVVILASFSITSQGLPFEDFGLASVADNKPAVELKRSKRTLTTICVEIKPSSPYEEPYFMCKGTDSPKYSKGSSSTSSESYSSKPSYKPSKPSTTYASDESDSYHSGVNKKNNDYHVPSKPEYHTEHSKYDKPAQSAYDSAKEYSSPSKPSYDKNPSFSDHHHSDPYPTYQVPPKQSSYASAKPSYGDHHGSHQDDYAKLHHQAHKVTYEKPSEPAYSAKPHTYSNESPSAYDHRQPSGGYSKPSSYESHTAPGGYSKPSSPYEPTEYSKPSSYEHHGSAYDSNPSYNAESHSKPSYGEHDGHSYSAPPETKVLYSKPASYPAKQTSYEHADNTQYGQPKPAYSEQSAPKPYSKPTQDYGKPAPYSAPINEHHSRYAPQPQHYRTMPPQDLMQPTWETQPQQLQFDGFGYRSYGAPMEYQNLEAPRTINHESQMHTGLEGPLRFDLSETDQEAPTLQSSYPYSAPAHQVPSYGQVAPSYAPPPVHYAPPVPSYPSPAYPSVAPSYAAVPAPSYVPLQVPSTSYSQSAAPSSYGAAPSSHGSAVPACRQNYMYSFQPVIMSVPCYSFSGGYGSSNYGQSLGAPASSQNFHPSNINPLQDHSSVRSEGNSESNTKSAEDHSGSQESQESDTKSDTEAETSHSPSSPKKLDNLKMPSVNGAEEKHNQHQTVDKNAQDQAVAAENKPITNEGQNGQTAGGVTPPKSPEVPNTKEAFNAMMKMARIAAQLNKDDTNKAPTADAGGLATLQGNEKPSSSGTLPQFSRTK